MISPLPPTNDEQWSVYFILDDDAHIVHHAASYMEWKAWMASDPDRHVAKTLIDGYRVSTIFWGIAEYGPDKLFETMLFKGDSSRGLAAWRCASWEEAEVQHERACAWVREQLAIGALPPLSQAEPVFRTNTTATRSENAEFANLTHWDIAKLVLQAFFLPRFGYRRGAR